VTASPESTIVVCGIPVSGKSTFARSLAKRGFYYFTLNGEDDAFRVESLQQEAWHAYLASFASASVDPLLPTLLKAPSRPVVEWGLPPNDPALELAKALRETGVRFVWFACPEPVARSRFRTRERGNVHKMAAFRHQMEMINSRHDAIMEAIRPQVVEVLRDGRAARANDDLYREIFEA
jgi:predicted kinase